MKNSDDGGSSSTTTTRRRSRAAHRQKVGTPGRTGVEFEATVQDADDDGSQGAAAATETFSYDEVSALATVTPAVKRSGKGASSRAVAEVSGKGRRSEGGGVRAAAAAAAAAAAGEST